MYPTPSTLSTSKTPQITRKRVFITYCITKCYSDPPMAARRVHVECHQRSFPGAAALSDAWVLRRKHRLCAAYTTRTPPVEPDSGYDLPSFMPCRGCRRFFLTGFEQRSNPILFGTVFAGSRGSTPERTSSGVWGCSPMGGVPVAFPLCMRLVIRRRHRSEAPYRGRRRG